LSIGEDGERKIEGRRRGKGGAEEFAFVRGSVEQKNRLVAVKATFWRSE
jgi:hypothetical protein